MHQRHLDGTPSVPHGQESCKPQADPSSSLFTDSPACQLQPSEPRCLQAHARRTLTSRMKTWTCLQFPSVTSVYGDAFVPRHLLPEEGGEASLLHVVCTDH